MKQIIQDLKNGNTVLEDIPAPIIKPGHLLIKTSHSLVSLGTERMLVEFGKANLIEKARQQPDKVKQVLDKIRADGLLPTLEAVFNKLNQPLPLGYCNAGIVVELGSGVTSFKIGDRVASNGNHAEYVCVPENLCAKIPDNVSDEEATFTVIGSIALQGIRLLNPTFGETIVVTGLGLIGLITAELLKANGCQVIGIDIDKNKCEIAEKWGIIAVNPSLGVDPVKSVLEKTDNIGADGIIITASAKNNEIISQSAQMSRRRGRIVLVGVIGLDLVRSDFYEKELTFQVSCSYGPGRYDEKYEEKGHDYPIGYVRWTEKRNFEAILQGISSGILDVKSLITERVQLDNYLQIYGDIKHHGSVASILVYPNKAEYNQTISVSASSFKKDIPGIGLIGAGNFASSTILPSLKYAGANVRSVASAKGLTAKILAKKIGAAYASSNYKELLDDANVNCTIISTRHDLHAQMVIESLNAGKHTFVEKPLCLNESELEEIIKTYKQQVEINPVTLTVGFNRRFAPLAQKLKKLIGNGPKNIVATMNAGFIPPEVWVHDLSVGGGRIIGEACHFVDLCTFLAGSKVVSVCTNALGPGYFENTDNASILLKYENGTNAVINYFANGSKAFAKEHIEVFCQGKTFVLDNWRKLSGFGIKGFKYIKTKQDKGHKAQFALLCDHLKNGGEPLIPMEEIINTTRVTFAAIRSLKEGCWVNI